MPPPPISDLTERARIIFREIVETYLETGQPVGSRTISKLGSLGLSAASIRGVMQDLEEVGLLGHPHTSAGRAPTEQGLRLFVDGMMRTAEPTPEERSAMDSALSGSPGGGGGAMEDVLARVSAALSGLSACAGLVLVPKAEPVLRQLSFAPLGDNRALAILVGTDGSVENRVVELAPGTPPGVLTQAANYANARLAGVTLGDAAGRLHAEIERDRGELDTLTADLIGRGLAAWSSDGARPILIVRGQANLIGADTDLDRVRLLLGELEGKEELSRLLDGARDAAACKVFIGAENKLFALSGSSIIAAPYSAGGGRVVGVVGVIGPTRLNYARVVPMVDYAAATLTRLIA